MKKILLAVLLLGSTLTSTFSEARNTSKNSVSVKNNLIECRHGQCQATAKSTGKQCKHCVSNSGDKFCFQHK
jgi:hypothetical protein